MLFDCSILADASVNPLGFAARLEWRMRDAGFGGLVRTGMADGTRCLWMDVRDPRKWRAAIEPIIAEAVAAGEVESIEAAAIKFRVIREESDAEAPVLAGMYGDDPMARPV